MGKQFFCRITLLLLQKILLYGETGFCGTNFVKKVTRICQKIRQVSQFDQLELSWRIPDECSAIVHRNLVER